MKLKLCIFLCCLLQVCTVWGQQTFKGRVTDVNHDPLADVTVYAITAKNGVKTLHDGSFSIQLTVNDTLRFSALGFKTLQVPVSEANKHIFILEAWQHELDAVTVQTGYYGISKERSTGSFAFVDSALFNRSVSSDVISRLEGVTNGLNFDRRGSFYADDNPSLQVRGISTINANTEPLVVLDNFPYEGDIYSINPNDIESVTVLKDAAAASIWGARAANGVIVMTTKRGMRDRPPIVSFNSNMSLSEKPDLLYSPDFIPAPDFIQMERTLFENGFYAAAESNTAQTPLTPAVEWLIKARDGLIAESILNEHLNELGKYDVRKQAADYLYQRGLKQQYALNIKGGGKRFDYYLSGGYDKNSEQLKGNGNNRVSVRMQGNYHLFSNLSISSGIYFVQNRASRNGLRLYDIRPGSKDIYPYAQLADEQGTPLVMINRYRLSFVENAEQEGLLNWDYKPLEDQALNNEGSGSSDVLLNTAINYRFRPFLNLDVRYQYQRIHGDSYNLRDADSYYVRDLVNRFTQSDGTQVFPEGDVLNQSYSNQVVHAGRAQLNFNKQFHLQHDVTALAGMEIRQVHTTGQGWQLLGYDPNVLTYQSMFNYTTYYPQRPTGSAKLPAPSASLSDLLDRYVSYYANAAYTYRSRYMLSGSVRWDASNLFGVKANQRGVPLWSLGGSWLVDQEKFFHIDWLSRLKLRLTYGFNGNVDKSSTAYVTAAYENDKLTGLRRAVVRSPGNPQLRWEKVGVWNAGIDYAIQGNRVQGSIELYRKMATDLLGDTPLDPTVGFTGVYRINYADMQTKGLDIEINSLNIKRPFSWQSTLLLSLLKDEVKRYNADDTKPSDLFTASSIPRPMEGLPLYRVYSYPWQGLDHDTGDPLVMVNGEVSKDYNAYIQQVEMDDLIYHGAAMPTMIGSLRNTFGWKDFSLSATITWKAGYYFKRNSISYSSLFNQGTGHMDFLERWQQPGDERVTNVPSMPTTINSNRDLVYTRSELLVEKGDHIRLQDLRVGYTLHKPAKWGLPMHSLSFYLYGRNLGILWRANKKHLDPDLPKAPYPQTKTFSLGLNVTL